jgi:hypothetical protein
MHLKWLADLAACVQLLKTSVILCRLHNKELYALYSSPDIIWVVKSRRLRWAGQVACKRERRGAYRVLVKKPEGRRPLERPRHRRGDNIKTVLQEVGWEA